MLKKLDFPGNSYIGVFCASNDDILVLSPHIPRKIVREMEEALKVSAVQTILGGSTVIGSLISLNSHGAVVSNLAEEAEIKKIKGLGVAPIDHRLNAVGNTILVNDRGAVVHPGYDDRTLEFLSDIFGVEVVRGTIAGARTVGSVAVATNKGVLCHPHATQEEIALLREALKVEVAIATANYGTPQIGACMVANDKGAVVGTTTTPVELGRIEEGLKLY